MVVLDRMMKLMIREISKMEGETMKKLFYLGMAALAAFSFSSCQKEMAIEEPGTNLVNVTLRAEKAGETRTAVEEGETKASYVWSESDVDNLKVFTVTEETTTDDEGETTTKEVLTPVEGATAEISDNIMTINATVPESSIIRAVVSGGWTNDGKKPRVKVPQNPVADSFDPTADILVSDDTEIPAGETEFDGVLSFNRPITVNKMTLKELVEGEKISKVVISSSNNIAGYYNGKTMTGDVTELTLKYDDVAVDETGEFPVYFIAIPSEGNHLTVKVYSDQYTYTKSFGTVNFAKGKFSKFGVKLDGYGKPVVETDYTGEWVITGNKDTDAFAAKAFESGTNLKALAITLDVPHKEIKSTDVDVIKMTFTKITEGDYKGFYTIQDANGLYLKAASKTANQLKADKMTEATADYYWEISDVGDGTNTIIAEKSENRNNMRFNSSSSLFSCYSSGQSPVTIYPASWLVKEEQEEEYDFETVAELNQLAASTAKEVSGYLTDAVVSFVPSTSNAIIKDETGSILLYMKDHGLKQGQTFTGETTVTVTLYNKASELTDIDANFTGEGAVVDPEIVTLSDLVGNFAKYQNAYVSVADLNVTNVDGKNISVENGGKEYVVFQNAGTVECAAGDVISVIGTICQYSNKDQVKVWTADDLTITQHHTLATHVITFSQPAQGGTFVVSVEGEEIESGAEVMEGTEVTLTATPSPDFSFTSWSITGATPVNASSATTTFTVGTNDVEISASFKSNTSTLTEEEITGTFTLANSALSLTTESGITIVQSIVSGSTAVNGNYNTPTTLRVYRGHGLTFSGKTIKRIEITVDGTYYGNSLTANTGTLTPTTTSGGTIVWEGSADSVTITNVASASNVQLRTKKIVVSY